MKKLLYILLFAPLALFGQAIVNANWNCGEPFFDSRDGKEYLTTLIGNQCWFSENLCYVPTYGYDSFQEWYINRDNGYYWVHNDSIGIVDSLGIYYSSDVIINTEICPSGTRVPSQSDLSDLNSFPGVNSVTLTVGGWTEFNLLENSSAYSLNNSHSPSLSANGVVESYFLFYNSNGAGINNSLGSSSATADNLPVRCIVNGSSTNELGTISGCQDFVANNFAPLATEDDSSCTYEIISYNEFMFTNPMPPIIWGYDGITTGATDTYGLINTTVLVDNFNQNQSDNPASICSNLNSFGYSDWYLPSISEMSSFHSFTQDIYESDYYWSSTEKNSNSTYVKHLSNTYTYSHLKSTSNPAFCIRKNDYGCIDSTALNYDLYANISDGNCIEKVFGCMDNNAVNFNSNANVDDSSCEYEVVLDNGFYIIPYEISEPMQWGFFGLETNINSSNGFVNTNQLDYIFNTINNTTITPVSYCINMDLFGFDDWYLPSYSEMSQINSSLNNVYPNNTYLWTSTEVSSTTSYTHRINSSQNSSQKDYEYNFTCIRKDFFGCTDSTALNYDIIATVDDGNCIEKVFGCMDDNAVNFNSNANVDDSSCGYEVVLDNGFYIIPYALSEPMQWGFYGLETGSSSSSDGISNTSILNNLYLSSDQSVTTPASYCVNMELFGFDDWYLPSSSEMSQINSSLYNIYPSNTYLWTSTEVSSTNSYTHRINSSQNSSQKDYEYDFTCIRKDFFGCTDSTALNFDEIATIDDGNCIEKVFGCIDSHAYNYNSVANTEDSSCVYLSSQIVFEEDFNDFYSNLTDIDNSVWEYSTSLNSIITNTFDSSPFLISQGSYYAGDNNNYVLPIYIDTNNIDSLSLTFDFILGHYAYTDYLYVSNDSLNWIEIGIFNSSNKNTNWDSPSEFSIDFSNYINDTIFLRFYRQQYSNNSDYIAIDNIKLLAYNFDLGCSDLEAINYNPLSEINYGDCIYALNVDSVFMNEYQNLNTEYNILVENYEDLYNSSDTGIIFIDLYEGWNMIGYVRSHEQDVVATLQSINTSLDFVKNNNGDVFWPEFGYNSIGNFIPGQGYQMKLKNDEFDFFFPFVEGLRIELTPTVPSWAIDMEAQIHPNDIRTLVRVVNMLGQEVNPENVPSGTVLLYLYNDATVEKKLTK